MVLSALQSTELRWNADCGTIRLLFSCRLRAAGFDYCVPRFGEQDAAALAFGDGSRDGDQGIGLVRRVAGVLLYDGIGDTIAFFDAATGGDRREEVYAACELLQSLALRSFRRA